LTNSLEYSNIALLVFVSASLLQEINEGNLQLMKIDKNNLIKPLIVVIILVVLIGAGIYYFQTRNGKTSVAGSKVAVQTQTITPKQTFELKTGLEGGKDSLQPLKVTLQSAQLTNRIFVKNKPKYARSGAKYLLINLLIENPNIRRLNIRSKDFIRLIDNSNKKFAPSIVDKDVLLEPDAVRKDTVGFAVPDNIKDFKIQYGLPTGDKQIIELKFNK
jgi:hypothetical protein